MLLSCFWNWNFLTLVTYLHASALAQIHAELRSHILTCVRLGRQCEKKQDQRSFQCVTQDDRENGQKFKVDIVLRHNTRLVFTHCVKSPGVRHMHNNGPHLLLGRSMIPNGGELRLLSGNNSSVFKNIGNEPWAAFIFLAKSKSILVGYRGMIQRHSVNEGVPSKTIFPSLGARDFAVDENRSLVFFVGIGKWCLIHRMTSSAKNRQCIYQHSFWSSSRLAIDVVRRKVFISLKEMIATMDYKGRGFSQVQSRGSKVIGVDSITNALYYGESQFSVSKPKYTITRRNFDMHGLDAYSVPMAIYKTPIKIVVLEKRVFLTAFRDSKVYSFPLSQTLTYKPEETSSGFGRQGNIWMSSITFNND